MAKGRCRTPLNRIVMMRAKGIGGPFFQNVGDGVCLKGSGNYYAPGMPGSGPQAVRIEVTPPDQVRVFYTQCLNVLSAIGSEYSLNGGAWIANLSFAKVDDVTYDYTLPVTFDECDTVAWRYVGGNDTHVDCDDAEDIGNQGPLTQVGLGDPVVVYAGVDSTGTSLLIQFDQTVTGNTVFTLEADGVKRALSAPINNAANLHFTCEPVYAGQALTLFYSPGDVASDCGSLQAFANKPVVNASTVPAPAPGQELSQFVQDDGAGTMRALVKAADNTTYTSARSTTGTVDDFEGRIVEGLPYEILFKRGRRVENLASGNETQTITVVAGHAYWVTIGAGSTGSVACTGAITQTIAGDASRKTWAGGGGAEIAATTSLVLTVTGTVTELFVEDVTGSTVQGAPSEPNAGMWQGSDYLDFDGVDDCVSLPNVGVTRSAHTMIISFRFDGGSGNYYLFDAGINQQLIQITSRICRVYNGLVQNFGNVVDGGRYSVARRTSDGLNVDLFFDNVETITNQSWGASIQGTVPHLGAHNNGLSNYFPGQMFYALLYNRALTDEELTTIYEGGTVSSGLVWHYEMNDGEGHVLTDSSGNDNHGTLKNYQLFPKYYSTSAHNNSVDVNGVVTQGTPSVPITDCYYMANPAATNSILNSINILEWDVVGSPGVVYDEVGISGAQNSAATITDTSNSSHEGTFVIHDIVADNDEHSYKMRIKQSDDETTFPRPSMLLRVGASTIICGARYHLNKKTGATIATNQALGTHRISVELINGFWEVTLTGTNNGTGTQAWLYLTPANGTVFGTEDTAATGSAVFDAPEFYKNTSNEVAKALPYIPTSGTAQTRVADLVYYDAAGNYNDGEGVLTVRFEPTVDQADYTDLAEGLVSLDGNAESILYVQRAGFRTTDGTSVCNCNPGFVAGVEYELEVAWSVANGLRIRCRDITNTGDWIPGSSAVYDDGFATDANITLAAEIIRPVLIRNVDFLPTDSSDHTPNLSMVMTVETTAPAETFTLPAGDVGTYNATIDWGDDQQDTITAHNDAALAHEYADAGVHTITITGSFPWIRFINAGDKNKIKTIENWGQVGTLSLSSSYRGCSDLLVNATDVPNTSLVTDYSYGFDGAVLFNAPIGAWDFSSALLMNSMLQNDTLFNQPIGNLVVSSVTTFGYLFYLNSAFNQDIGKWNMSSATNMTNTFFNVSAMDQGNVDSLVAGWYRDRMDFGWATPTANISFMATPSGVYQDANPPTTGLEFVYKLENDPDGEGFNTWAITY